MSEQTQNVQQQTQDEQALQDARDFFGQSMGRILGQMESDNAQLQSYMQQLPDDTQAQDTVGGDGGEVPRATNAARRRAEELGIDLSTIKGTGSGGLITIRDVTGS